MIHCYSENCSELAPCVSWLLLACSLISDLSFISQQVHPPPLFSVIKQPALICQQPHQTIVFMTSSHRIRCHLAQLQQQTNYRSTYSMAAVRALLSWGQGGGRGESGWAVVWGRTVTVDYFNPRRGLLHNISQCCQGELSHRQHAQNSCEVWKCGL